MCSSVTKTLTFARHSQGIVVEPKEEKTKWKTIYVVPPVCPYCKMQFKAFSSLKMHYRYHPNVSLLWVPLLRSWFGSAFHTRF